MTYTKGEWYWDYRDRKPFNLRAKSSDKGYEADVHILFVADDFLGENSLVNKANAQLIASAPDLYEALEILLEHYLKLANSGDCGFWHPETEIQVIKARKAIAKAESK